MLFHELGTISTINTTGSELIKRLQQVYSYIRPPPSLCRIMFCCFEGVLLECFQGLIRTSVVGFIGNHTCVSQCRIELKVVELDSVNHAC